jgi:VIT1/CCC1 family predicted Fe2+/Mn2+ transporter
VAANQNSSQGAILVAGLSGLVAGACSMAVGEYVSVSSQRDLEHADLKKEEWEIENNWDGELEELTLLYEVSPVLSLPTCCSIFQSDV